MSKKFDFEAALIRAPLTQPTLALRFFLTSRTAS